MSMSLPLPLPSLLVLGTLSLMALLLALALLFLPPALSWRPVPVPDDPYIHLSNIYHPAQIPQLVVPYAYRVYIEVFVPYHDDLDFGNRNMTFEAEAELLLNAKNSSSRVILHCYRLNVTSVAIYDEFNNTIPLNFTLDSAKQIMDIRTAKVLEKEGKYTMKTKHGGKINTKEGTLNGIFTVPHKHGDQTYWTVATHAQPYHARKILPCMDLPYAKATFELTLAYPKGLEALSNTMETGTTEVKIDGRDMLRTHFGETPIMSTYIFAFALHCYPYIKTNYKHVEIRVYAQPQQINDTRLVLDFIPPLLLYYEDYFQYPYPLPKLYLVVLPDIEVLAMENWGLILCRQDRVLFNEDHNIISKTKSIYEIISHEVAHQWFGNLVTLRWWDNLWLNEGFATMMGKMACDHIQSITIREEDELDTSRVLRKDIHDASPPLYSLGQYMDPKAAFNAISYTKGSILLHMIEYLVGKDAFRAGVRHFIKKFIYSNADHNDLISSFQETYEGNGGMLMPGNASFTLRKFFESWITQKGFPLVEVESSPTDLDVVTIHQYVYMQSVDMTWPVPIFVRDVGNTTSTHWLMDKSRVNISIGSEIVMDPEARTYMRVKYDAALYERIIQLIKNDVHSISLTSRLRLMDDSFTFAEHGLLSYEIPLRLVFHSTKEHERGYMPMKYFSSHLDVFRVKLYHLPEYHLVKKYIFLIFEPHFEQSIRLDGPQIKIHEDKLSAIVLTWLCYSGHEKCLTSCLNMWKLITAGCKDYHLSNKTCNPIPLHLRTAVYWSAANRGPQENFDFLMRKFMEEPFLGEKERIVEGIIGNTNKENMYIFFKMIIQYEGTPVMGGLEIRHILQSYIRMCHGVNHFKTFFIDHLDFILSNRSTQMIQLLFVIFSNCYIGIGEVSEFEQIAAIVAKNLRSRDVVLRPPISASINKIRIAMMYRRNFAPFIFSNLSAIIEGASLGTI